MFRSFSFNLVSKRKYPRENQSEKKKKKTTDLKPFSPPSNANKQSHNFLIFSSTESLGNTLPLPPSSPSSMSSRLIHRGRGIFPLEARSLVRRQRKKERKKKKKRKEGRVTLGEGWNGTRFGKMGRTVAGVAPVQILIGQVTQQAACQDTRQAPLHPG